MIVGGQTKARVPTTIDYYLIIMNRFNGAYLPFFLLSAKYANEPVIKSFGLQENSIAYIGSKINLTCRMDNTEVGIFLKSGVPIREEGRFMYNFENLGREGLVGSLEIADVMKEDEGIYTCYAFKAGNLALKTFMLKTGL